MLSVTESMVAWLAAMGYRASTRVPEKAPGAPSEFVTVERTNGGVTDFIDSPQFAVQTWAPTEARAEEMANEIRMQAMAGPPPDGFGDVRPAIGPYPFFDESTRCPRYQTVYECTAHV